MDAHGITNEPDYVPQDAGKSEIIIVHGDSDLRRFDNYNEGGAYDESNVRMCVCAFGKSTFAFTLKQQFNNSDTHQHFESFCIRLNKQEVKQQIRILALKAMLNIEKLCLIEKTHRPSHVGVIDEMSIFTKGRRLWTWKQHTSKTSIYDE